MLLDRLGYHRWVSYSVREVGIFSGGLIFKGWGGGSDILMWTVMTQATVGGSLFGP